MTDRNTDNYVKEDFLTEAIEEELTNPATPAYEPVPIIGQVKWLLFWIALALLTCGGIYFALGHEKAIEFLGGYLIELSLSIDNVFVFMMIFVAFGIREHAQHRVLAWGIIGAIVLRFFFIFFGVQLVSRFEWILYIFGVLLVVSGIKMFKGDDEEKDPHDSKVLKIMSKFIPMSKNFDGDKFFTIENGVKMATPLLAVVVLIESSDIMFAIDSVPAVLSVSHDLLIVYSSNIFAILGLRQLFFVIEHMRSRFCYVQIGVACILVFTGLKMVSGIVGIHISTPVSIGFILLALALSIGISAWVTRDKKEA